MALPTQWAASLGKLQETEKDREAWRAAFMGSQESDNCVTEQQKHSKIHGGRKQNGVHQETGEGKWALLFTGTEFQFGGRWKVPAMVMGTEQCERT